MIFSMVNNRILLNLETLLTVYQMQNIKARQRKGQGSMELFEPHLHTDLHDEISDHKMFLTSRIILLVVRSLDPSEVLPKAHMIQSMKAWLVQVITSIVLMPRLLNHHHPIAVE